MSAAAYEMRKGVKNVESDNLLLGSGLLVLLLLFFLLRLGSRGSGGSSGGSSTRPGGISSS